MARKRSKSKAAAKAANRAHVPKKGITDDEVRTLAQNAAQNHFAENSTSFGSGGTISRASLQTGLGKTFNGERDLYRACGYPEGEIDYRDYDDRYRRQDIATRVVDAPPRATWKDMPRMSTENEALRTAWDKLVKRLKIQNSMQRVDIISGIGRYAVLLMGFKGGKNEEMKDPIEGSNLELLYLQPYSEDRAVISKLVTDKTDPRFAMPELYTIQVNSANETSPRSDRSKSTQTITVHWSRVLHVAEGLMEDNIFGIPRLRSPFNRLIDIEKIAGGSAEMYWNGAQPGYNFSIDPDINLDEDQKKVWADEIDSYVNGRKRYTRMQGMDIKAYEQQVEDPKGHMDIQLMLLSASTSMPIRILTGSERGELASSQDEDNWNKHIDERRENYAEPCMLTPFAEHMQELKILPAGDFDFEWDPAFQLSEETRSKIASTRMKALRDFVDGDLNDTVLPVEDGLREIFGWSDDKIAEVGKVIAGFRSADADEEAADLAAAEGSGHLDDDDEDDEADS